MVLPDGALLQKISAAVAAAANDLWRSSTLSITAASTLLGADLSIERPDGSVDRSRGVEDEVLDWCDELRDVMYTEGDGTWYNATVTVTADGQIETTFDNDNPPFNREDVPDDLLIQDHEEYPRNPDRLPAWHPSKVALT